jgi:hypothetical protein
MIPLYFTGTSAGNIPADNRFATAKAAFHRGFHVLLHGIDALVFFPFSSSDHVARGGPAFGEDVDLGLFFRVQFHQLSKFRFNFISFDDIHLIGLPFFTMFSFF